MKKFPLDVYAIENVDKWYKDFVYPFNVSELHLKFSEQIKFCFEEIADLFHDNEKYLFRISSVFIFIDFYNLLYNLRLTEEIKKRSNEFSFVTTKSLDCINYYNGNFESYGFVTNKVLRGKRSKENIKRMLIRKLYPLFYRKILRNSEVLRFRPNKTSSRLINDYFASKGYLIYCNDFIRKEHRYSSECRKFDEIASKISSILRKYLRLIIGHSDIPNELLTLFETCIKTLLSSIYIDYGNAKKFVDRKKLYNHTLITGTGGSYSVRILTEALKFYGGRVIATTHGGGAGGFNFPSLVWKEFISCDSFACFSQKDIEDYKSIIMPNINKVNFMLFKGIEDSIFEVPPLRKEKFSFSKIKTIMHISSAYDYNMFRTSYPVDLLLFDLQLKIIKYFLQFNKKYIFKVRMKSEYFCPIKFNHLGYFSNRVEYNYKSFTEVLKNADLFIFESVGSSALWEAMTLTDKPIILFLPPYPKEKKIFWKTIANRCFVIKQYLDDKNRLNFDPSELNGILLSKNPGFDNE